MLQSRGVVRSYLAVSSMKKIRINELARELEVKPGVILDMLPELGVQEKKTHSSSIDEDVASRCETVLVGTGRSDRGSRNAARATIMTMTRRRCDDEDSCRSVVQKRRPRRRRNAHSTSAARLADPAAA